jgi:NAD(P)-dependent dehydrogenase (short-subunit alcohol dehydrogenase family)
MRVLITGANRGIGLALVREYLDAGWRVFATCRAPDRADDLRALCDAYDDRLSIVALDVVDEASIQRAGDVIREETDTLDALINNAGVFPKGERPGALDADEMLYAFHVNAIGPVMVGQEMLDPLRAAENPRVVNVTSQLGSLARKRSGGDYSYTASKAALNMLTKALAYDLRREGIIVVAIHPGWVQTDMGGVGATLAPEESARRIREIVDGLTPDDAARYLQVNGDDLPW